MPARKASTADGDFGPGTDARSRGKDGKEKETFGCPYPGCGQSYSRMEYLKRHQRKHQDVRPFACKDCSKSFARSDVLLRHRRRCHPTPPPADRSSRSPVPVHRGYPGVPVSSSRNDLELASPPRSRKHPRQSSASETDGQNGPSRRRLNHQEPEEDDDDERFGESSRLRQNGMGNGGVYGGMSSYYGADPESSTYTPHLLPIFQHAPTYAQSTEYQQDDSNHLEDASVLLSMAYGSASGNEPQSHPSDQSQPEPLPNWDTAPNLNMMMDATRNKSDPLPDENIINLGPGDSTNVLPDPTPNFLAAMNWLGTSKTGTTPGEGADSWPNTNGNSPSKGLSPFSSFFSPSAFNFGPAQEDSHGNGNSGDEEFGDTNEAVMTVLSQLAQYEVPQTKANPNPERPLLRVWHEDLMHKAGPEIDIDSKFHLPADRFGGCYQIPHWALPPLKTLSLMANRTFDTVLDHFSFVHRPTFRLTDTAACLAFAICTVGGVRSTKLKYEHLYREQYQIINKNLPTAHIALDGPVPPAETWESMYHRNYSRDTTDAATVKEVEEWENGHIVRNEKTNMLVKSFSMAQGVLMTEYNVALLQALILYHAPFFLSEEENERNLANMFLGTIVSIGFFSSELEHFNTTIDHPGETWTPNELDLYWRRWIQLETRRRTAFLVYQLDTICAIECNIPCILTGCELSYLPLPAPDTLWKAPTAEAWLKAVRNYRPMTLDEAMRRTFFLPTYGAFDALHERADTKFYNLLNQTELGPFARVAMILTLLRGIMDIGEGKRDRGDWRDLTDLWISCSWLRPGKVMLDSSGKNLGEVTEESLRDRFSQALERWREGWDFDPSCPNPGTGASSVSNASPNSSTSPGSGGSRDNAEKKLIYCEEALPYYWLSIALLNILKQAPPHEPGWNVFAPGPVNNMQGVRYGEMLKSARMFTRMGEGVAVPSFGGNKSSTGMTPSMTTASSSGMGLDTVPSTADLSSGPATTFATGATGATQGGNAADEENMFAGISFEELLGGYGAADILAN